MTPFEWHVSVSDICWVENLINCNDLDLNVPREDRELLFGELAGSDGEFAESVHLDEGGEVFCGGVTDVELDEVGAFEVPEVGDTAVAYIEGVDGEDTQEAFDGDEFLFAFASFSVKRI